jgi:hypothetical protein
MAKRRAPTPRLRLEWLEERSLLSQFSLGALVQAAVTDPFAACKPGNQTGVYFPGTQVEPRLAVDPTNPKHMIGAWQQERWDDGGSFGTVAAVTFDTGQTWTEVVIPGLTGCSVGPYDRASDPCVSFGPTGTVYISSLGLDGNDKTGTTESAILVNRSTDGGLTWSQPATLIQSGKGVLNDKESITADPHNASLVYAVWDQPNLNITSAGPGGQTYFSRSSDGGQTWSASQVIFQSPTNASNIGHQIVVLPNGTLVDAFSELQFNPSTLTTTYAVDILRSIDGGASWSAPIVVAQEMTQGAVDPFNRLTARTGANLPEISVDPASGNLYAVWEDARFSAQFLSLFESIAFSMSRDGGLTWSSPIQVNETPVDLSAPFDSQAFTPSIAVGGDCTVAVTYSDFRNQGTIPGAATDDWVVFGNPQGSGGLTNPANWGNELRLTNSSFNLLNAPSAGGWFLGDYEGLAAEGNNFDAFFSQAGSTFPQASIFARQIFDSPTGSSPSQSAAPTLRADATLAATPRAAAASANPSLPSSLSGNGSSSPFPTALPSGGTSDPSGFLAPVSYAADKGPVATVVGDFNHDGIPDLVVANQSSSDVSVLLGNGDGTFRSGKTFAVDNGPWALAAGDFNGDGNLDIVTANSRDLTVLFGNGDGTFKNTQMALTLPNVIANQVPQCPLSVAVGDFNHDGKLDLAVTAVANLNGPRKGFLDLLLGQGNGTFTVASVTPINSSSPLSVALADFNGDGNLDAAIGNSMDLVGAPGGGGISVLFGKGDGTFQETTDVYPDVALLPMAVAVGDFDNDQTPDIVVTGSARIGGIFYAGAVSVSLSNGNGTFQPPQLFPVSQNLDQQAVAVGDFNRDGNLDIATATDDTVSVLLSNGKGGFQSPVSFSSGATFNFRSAVGLAVGDFNGDRFPDLAIPSYLSNTVQVLINSGTWDPPAITAATAAPALTQPSSSAASVGTTVTRPAALAPAMLSETVVEALDWFLTGPGQEAQPDSGPLRWGVTGWSGPQGPWKWLRNGVKSQLRV